LHTEPPYFPNGVAAVGNDVYVLEVGFTLPNLSSGPRVRKISANGKQAILATVGATNSGTEEKSSLGVKAGVLAENTLVLVSGDGRWRYAISVIAFGILSLAFLIWQRKRRARA
jgi:hypothetical protein